jgi:integrase
VREVLLPDQVKDLAGKLGELARSITLLLVLTGLRIGELLALRWGNVDLDAGILRVMETVYDGTLTNPKRSLRRRNPGSVASLGIF